MEGKSSFLIGYAATGDPLGRMRPLEKQTEAAVQGLGCTLVRSSLVIDGASAAARAAAELREKGADMILLRCNALAGEGEIASAFIDSGVPLAVWCVPEPQREGLLYLNSMTCANLYMSVANFNLRDRDTQVKWLYGTPEDPLFRNRLDVTVRALRAVRRIRGARIAQLGGTAPGFINMEYDRAAFEKKLGCEIVTLELDEIYASARAMSGRQTEEELARLSRAPVSDAVRPSELDMSARLILALRKYSRENHVDAMAVSCWPGFQEELGISSCMAYGQLNDGGMICACEGDVPGAVSMLLLDSLSGRHPMIMDLVTMDRREDALAFWHCGMGMPSYADDQGFSFIKYPSYPEIMDQPGVSVDMKFAPQPATIARIGGRGAETLLVSEADIIEGPDRSYTGARGWFGNFRVAGRPAGAVDFWNTVCASGNAHHYVITAGHVGDACMEFAHRMHIQPIEKAEYHDYL